MSKVIVYIDGFNLFHAIDELNTPNIKWVNLYDLAQSIIRGNEEIEAVKYFTAYATWKPAAHRRHERYVSALREAGVEVILGKFKKKRVRCKADCGQTFFTHEEKETDVNIGAYLVADAIKNRFDRAIVVTADTDIAAAIEVARHEAPDKTINPVAPPNRMARARELEPQFEITKGKIRAACFDKKTENYIVDNIQ